MMPKQKRAIGRLRAIRADGGQVVGTAFLVTDRYLLTAFHVVGDRARSASSGTPVAYPALLFDPDGDEAAAVTVRMVADACDPVSDWALLESELKFPGVGTLPMGEVSAREVEYGDVGDIKFETWGFPTLAKMSGSGIAITGRVQDCDAKYQGAWAYQLYSENAAAALGSPLSGLSGAPCVVDGAAVGIIRSNLLLPGTNGPAHIPGGILYACPLATHSLQERCAAYLPSLDPIRGLPGLPRQPLPIEPFRYLRWYGAEHAEVFFGRNLKLRELYLQVTNPDTPPVVLVYGASGVGKSSLLEAGIFPRLSWDYAVRAQRREAGVSLVHSLDELLTAVNATSLEARSAAVLLDQMEEVFTDPRCDGDGEVAALGRRIRALLDGGRPVPKIMLGFRSDWLANIRARLAECAVPVSEFYLERFTRDEIEEVVRGVVSTERLRSFYRVGVDEQLPRRISDDLLSDPASPISPILSIILTRLWMEAKARPAGSQQLSAEVYEQRMRNRLDLDHFLTEQLRSIATTLPSEVKSGLVDDVLYRHTTDFGTAKELSGRELRETYHHLMEGDAGGRLSTLVATLGAHSLLYTIVGGSPPGGGEQQVTRLAHDTLAPPVRKRYQQSDLPGQRAERRLMSWVEDWDPSQPETGTLDAAALSLIEQGAHATRALTEKEREFLHASRIAIRAARRRQQHGRALLAGLVVLLLSGITVWWKEAWFREQGYWLLHVRTWSPEQVQAADAGTSFKECTHCPEMIVIPAGRFSMGSPPNVGDDNERPQRLVSIPASFAVSKFEITFQEWEACTSYGDCREVSSSDAGRGRQPVINTTWSDAKQYVAWLSRVTGRPYRLLSEAEWEYAARARSNTHFHFGPDEAVLPQYAWFALNAGPQTHEVGGKRPNSFGLHDMHGNVREWVEDCYRAYPADDSSRTAWSPAGCSRRVARGGSWLYGAHVLRSASREWETFDKRADDLGFRIARDVSP